jgi:hypothetical protein
LWWLEAHARAVRRGELRLPTVPEPAPAPEPLPIYDVELHAQMQEDIARLCSPTGPAILETSDGQGLHRRRTSSSLTADDAAHERDPTYLAQMRARKATLQAQAVLLQARASDLEVVGAAD